MWRAQGLTRPVMRPSWLCWRLLVPCSDRDRGRDRGLYGNLKATVSFNFFFLFYFI